MWSFRRIQAVMVIQTKRRFFMKKMLITVLICFSEVSLASVCMAEDQVRTVREDCGCGLGGYAIGEETGLLWKLLGTFLNGLCGNQTFAMSTGTLGCGEP